MAAGEWFGSFFQREPGWQLKKAGLVENTGVLDNPAVGWYHIFDFPLEVPVEKMKTQWFLDTREQLALVLVNIGFYQRRELDGEALDNLRKGLTFFRDSGKDLIVRAVYDCVGRGAESEPAQFERVCGHLQQLAQVLREFQDAVFVYQGMLLGSWGEMHSSRFLTKPRMKALLDILEKQLGEKTFLAVRRPVFYRMLRPKGTAPETRLGLYDDAIFGSETDLGTFGTQSAADAGWEASWLPGEELAFEEKLCRTVPQGGEALLGQSGPPTLKAAVSALQKMHITYLNSQYDPALLECFKKQRWTSRGVWNGVSGYDYIGAHLGYRFCVRDVSLRPGRGAPVVAITVENVGFAPVYQKFRMLLLQKTRSGTVYPITLEGELQGLTAGARGVALGQLRAEESTLYLRLLRCSDGREIRFGTQSREQPESTKQDGLLLGWLDERTPLKRFSEVAGR